MKKLILMRHAKSDWTTQSGSDHDRVLSLRGRKAAPKIAAWLATQGHMPDQILTSDAARTLETLSLMEPVFNPAPVVTTHRALYLANPTTMFEMARDATGDVVLMLAHNPGIAILAEALAGETSVHPRFLDYPTAATTVFGFDIQNWKDLPQVGQVLDFAIPREL